MSVLFETSLGDIVIDLETDLCPKTSENFLKLCKVYYYNLNAFFNGARSPFFFLLLLSNMLIFVQFQKISWPKLAIQPLQERVESVSGPTLHQQHQKKLRMNQNQLATSPRKSILN